MAAAAATRPARPATAQLAVRPAEKARLQAKFWPPSESKAAVKADVKARKDKLADMVRPRLRKLSEDPSRDPAIRKISAERDANSLAACLDALLVDVVKVAARERRQRISAANKGGVKAVVAVALSDLTAQVAEKAMALPKVLVPADKMYLLLLRELEPKPKATIIPANAMAVEFLTALQADGSPALGNYMSAICGTLQRLYDVAVRPKSKQGIVETVATGYTAWLRTEAAQQAISAMHKEVTRVVKVPTDGMSQLAALQTYYADVCPQKPASEVRAIFDRRAKPAQTAIPVVAWATLCEGLKQKYKEPIRGTPPSPEELAQFSSLVRGRVRQQFGRVMEQELNTRPKVRRETLGRTPLRQTLLLKPGSDAGSAYFAGAMLTAGFRHYGGPHYRNRRNDKSKRKQDPRKTALLQQLHAPRPPTAPIGGRILVQKKVAPLPTPPATPVVVPGAAASDVLEVDEAAQVELPDSDEDEQQPLRGVNFRPTVGGELDFGDTDDDDDEFWCSAADEIDLTTVTADAAPPGLLEFVLDDDPSDKAGFQGHHIDWRWKIDTRNKHQGRGLFYPTESYRMWRMAVARMRQHEGGLENHRRLGKDADERLKVQLLTNSELKGMFYSCFTDVLPSDHHDVDSVMIYMINWMWNADTDRHLEDTREYFDCYKSKAQATRRGSVSASAVAAAGKKQNGKKKIQRKRPQQQQQQQQQQQGGKKARPPCDDQFCAHGPGCPGYVPVLAPAVQHTPLRTRSNQRDIMIGLSSLSL